MPEQVNKINIQITKSGNGASQAKSDLKAVEDQARSTASAVESVSSSYGKVTQNLAGVRAAASEATSAFRNTTSGKDTFSDTAKSMDSLKKSSSGAKDAMKSVGDSVRTASGKVGSSNGIFKNFLGSLTRIAKLRLLRGIVRSVTGAFQEGTTNLYRYSQALNNADASHLSGSMDTLASTLLTVKNSIGAAVAPLISSLVPAIQTVAGWFITAANAVAQFFAVLGGQSTYTRAKQASTAWKGVEAGASGAAAAAQEYQNTILGFDEINALNDTSDGGGGGGGGGGGTPDFGDMFEEAPIDYSGIIGAFNKLAEALRPLMQELWHQLEENVEGYGLLIESIFDGIQGNIEQNVPLILESVDEMAEGFSKIPTKAWIFPAAADFVAEWSEKIALVKIGLVDFAEWLLTLPIVRTFAEMFGINVDEVTSALEKIKSGLIDDYNEQLKVNKLLDAFRDGVITVSGLFSGENLIRMGLHNLQDSFNGVIGKVEELRASNQLTRDSLLKLAQTNPKFMAILQSTGDVKYALDQIVEGAYYVENGILHLGEVEVPLALVDSIMGVGEEADTTSGKIENIGTTASKTGSSSPKMDILNSRLISVGDAAKGSSDKIDETKKKAGILGQYNFPNAQVISAFDNIKVVVDLLRNAITGTHTEAGNLGGYQFNTYGITSSLGTINGSASDTKWWLNTTRGEVIELGNTSLNAWAVNGGLSDIGWYANSASGALGTLKWNIDQINGSSIHITNGEIFGGGTLGHFAEGGFVTGYAEGGIIPRFDGGGIKTADLFMANENGVPEMVGRIGTRTAVANQQQLVESISNGVYRAMMSAQGGQTSNTEVTVYMNDEVVARSADRGNKALNRRYSVSLA